MSNQLRVQLVVLIVILSGCFFEFTGDRYWVGSAAEDPVSYGIVHLPSDGDVDADDLFLISGVQQVELHACTDEPDSFALVLDVNSGRELYRRKVTDQPVCEGDRLLWTGEDLIDLHDGLIFGLFKDPWPDDLYVAPFSVGSTADEPVLLEHGFSRRGSFETVGESLVDGVTHFTPGTICEPNANIPPYVVRVRDAQTRQVLDSEWLNRDICSSPRLHWNGEQLEVLDPGERLTRLPDDLYEQ